MIPRDIDNSTDPDVDHENPSHHGSDAQPANCSNVNKQLSTQDELKVNAHENTAYTNEDHSSVLCDKELCEGTIKSFSCTRCEMHFTSKEELTSHCETHKTAATHKCHVCDKSFTQKSNLKRHLQTHSGERPVKCNVCDKSFTRIKSLNVNLAKYTGERLFQSNICDKCFTQKDTLTENSRIPNNVRPFHNCNHSIMYSTKL